MALLYEDPQNLKARTSEFIALGHLLKRPSPFFASAARPSESSEIGFPLSSNVDDLVILVVTAPICCHCQLFLDLRTRIREIRKVFDAFEDGYIPGERVTLFRDSVASISKARPGVPIFLTLTRSTTLNEWQNISRSSLYGALSASNVVSRVQA